MIKTDDVVRTVKRMSDIIIANEVYFCELDSVAGDGDFGMSLAKGFKQILKDWEDLSKDNIGSFLKDCGMVITEYCGGASGPIWGTAFRSAGKFAKGRESITSNEISELLQAAVEGVQKRGGAKLGDKTLLDALIPAVEAMSISSEAGDSIDQILIKGAKAAADGAEKTKEIVALKGRASYLGERSLNHPDAGAMGISVIFGELVSTRSEVSV